MKPEDIRAIADLLKDDRTPCQRDGHNFAMLDANQGLLFCSKCGESKTVPKPSAGFGFQAT